MPTDAGVAGQVAELIALGTSLMEAGNLDAAIELFAGLQAIDPVNPAVNKPLGVALATAGRFAAAIPPLERVIGMQPNDILAHNVLSVCRFNGGDFAGALASADCALALFPGFIPAQTNRGNALWRLGRLAEARVALAEALAHAPDDAFAHINFANVLADLEDRDAALASLDRALAIDPRLAPAHTNRANVLQTLGRHAEALDSYAAALALDPDSVDAHWNRSLCNLLLGRFADGWPEYEWRWRRGAPENQPRDFSAPPWRGEPLEGRTLLLHCEQGFGDAIQFIRLAPLVTQGGGRVVVEAFAPLAELFESIVGAEALVRRGEPLPAADFQCPLMSLPLALGEFGAAPGVAAPYLAPPEPRRGVWRERLGPAQGPRVGLAAGGSPTHRADHLRSVPLADLLAILPPGPDYHLLQKDLTPADRALAESKGVAVWSDQLSDFADTAALCEQMDLVISVDTSVAHLAGALARPVWILIAHDPDWRWGLTAETSAWYPTARLLRQPVRGDWSGRLADLGRDLATWTAAASSTT